MLSNRKLIIEEIKRKSWVSVVLLLLALVTGPLLTLISYENWAAYFGKEELIESMERYFIRTGGMGAFLCVISAILLGLSQFSYLFYKNKVDLYHSIPVKRSRRFLVNYIAGLIPFFACNLISNILMIVFVASKGCFTGVLFSNLLLSFVSETVYFLYFYNVTIVAVMLTGNIVVCISGIGVLSFFYYLFTELVNGLKNYYFVTSHSIKETGEALWNRIPELSPATSYINFNLKRMKNWGVTPFENNIQAYGYLIRVMIVVVIILIFAFCLFEKRPSESAGKAMAFKKSQPYIRIPIVLTGGLFGASIMTSAVNAYKNGWIWFGLIFGIILTHCVMEVIYNFNFKAVLNNKLQLVLTIAAGCVILGVFQTDIIGYDRYLPDRDKIESAAVAFIELDNNLSCNTLEPAGDGIWESTSRSFDEQVFDNMLTDSVMIDKIYAIGSLGTTCVDSMIETRYGENNYETYNRSYAVAEDEEYAEAEVSLATDEPDRNKLDEANNYFKDNNIEIHELSDAELNRVMTTDVIFRLKSGRTVIRRYSIPVEKVELLLNEVYKTEEYKRVHFDLYDAVEKSAISTVEAYDVFENKRMSLTGSQMDKFLEIYTSELDKLTVDDLREAPVGRIYPKYKTRYYEEALYGYYIYPSFEKTIEYMDSIGIDMTYFTNEIETDKVQNMVISAGSLFERVDELNPNSTEYIYLNEVSYNPTDDAGLDMIEKAHDKLLILSFEEANYWITPYDSRVDVQIYYESENGMQAGFSCVFKPDTVPSELIEDLKIKLYEQETGM